MSTQRWELHIITCLKCGNQFRPGEDLDAKNKKAEFNAKIANSPIYKAVLKIVLGLLVFMILLTIVLSIFDKPNKESTPPIVSLNDSTNTELDKYYEIEKADVDRATQRNLHVYVLDKKKIKNINDILISKYNKDKNNYMTVIYIDKKGIEKLFDNMNTSDAEDAELSKHIIATYNFNPSNNYEELKYTHDDLTK